MTKHSFDVPKIIASYILNIIFNSNVLSPWKYISLFFCFFNLQIFNSTYEWEKKYRRKYIFGIQIHVRIYVDIIYFMVIVLSICFYWNLIPLFLDTLIPFPHSTLMLKQETKKNRKRIRFHFFFFFLFLSYLL